MSLETVECPLCGCMLFRARVVGVVEIVCKANKCPGKKQLQLLRFPPRDGVAGRPLLRITRPVR